MTSHLHYDRLVQEIAGFLGGDRSDKRKDAIANAFFASSRIKQIVAFESKKLGISGECDELSQEIVLVVLNGILETLDSPDNIYPMVLGIAKNTCLAYKRRTMGYNEGRYTSLDTETHDDDGESYEKIFHRDDGHFANADDNSIQLTEKRMSKEEAIKAMGLRINVERSRKSDLAVIADNLAASERGFSPLIAVSSPIARLPLGAIRAEKAKEKPPKVIPKDSLELAEIRRNLGLSIEAFATQLSAARGALTAYLYGRTLTVPVEIMKAARSLYAERGNLMATSSLAFKDRSMHEIALQWAETLGATEDVAISALSTALEIAPVTVKRWLSNKTRPDLNVLEDYSNRVAKLARSDN